MRLRENKDGEIFTKESIIEWTYCSGNLPCPLFTKDGEGDGVESLSLTLPKIQVSSIRKLALQAKDRKAHGAESIAERSNVKA
jgi:hypothetical protein